MAGTKELVEKEKILRWITKLFIDTDEKDWEKIKQHFSDEVFFDVTSMVGGEPTTLTPQQIVNGWEDGLKDIEVVHHQAGNFLVDISDTQAKVFCYAIASHYKKKQITRIQEFLLGVITSN